MIYGLYLSATGVLANSYRQDVIANNLANAETVGFKRDLALFQEQRTAAQSRGLNPRAHSNPLLEPLGGGLTYAATVVDQTPGEMEASSNPLDLAILGHGYFAVRSAGQTLLTRDGRFLVNRDGYLARAADGLEVLDDQRQPIRLNPARAVSIDRDGTISQNGQAVARLGLFDVADRSQLAKRARSLLAPADPNRLLPSAATVRGGFVERSNVDPATELTALMDAQRQLEANANMIRYQDQTLGRLVNDVGKIG